MRRRVGGQEVEADRVNTGMDWAEESQDSEFPALLFVYYLTS